MKDEPPTIYGDGEQSRDFTYIDNVVDANLLAARASQTKGEVINMINELLDKNVKPIYTAPRPGDVKHSLADITAAKNLIGFEPAVQFKDGLEKAIDWYKANLI